VEELPSFALAGRNSGRPLSVLDAVAGRFTARSCACALVQPSADHPAATRRTFLSIYLPCGRGQTDAGQLAGNTRGPRCARVGWWAGPRCLERGQRRKAGQPHEAPVGTLGPTHLGWRKRPSARRAPGSRIRKERGRQPFGWTGDALSTLNPAVDIRRPRLHGIGRVKAHHTVSGPSLRVSTSAKTSLTAGLAAKCTARSRKATGEEMAAAGTVVCALESSEKIVVP
jgi:hypothetical protein